MLYTKITQCRICNNTNLAQVVDMGMLALTGVFPRHFDPVEYCPLQLVKCMGDVGETCGLLQLAHNYDLVQLYGDNYGYRSSLNSSMVSHLASIVSLAQKHISLQHGDLVLDIGSNDSTLLQQYSTSGIQRVGIDPTISKFKSFYPKNIDAIADFFSAKAIRKHTDNKPKIITSIAMLYDLEHPLDFVQDIYDILADDGVWVFEQNYMPHMIEQCAYDTICHEHLEYYSLAQIMWLLEKVNMKIIDINTSSVNGGSLCVVAAKMSHPTREATRKIQALKSYELSLNLNVLSTYKSFVSRMVSHKKTLRSFLDTALDEQKVVYGLGASTRGNVILQYCKITHHELPFIAEVNEYKFGRYTPGSTIPIISQAEAHLHNPDYFFVLPWHFRQNITRAEQAYIKRCGKLVFPLPELSVIG